MLISNIIKKINIITIIWIFNGCEVWIEDFITSVTVRQHEACRGMPNSCPEWQNFQSALNNHYRLFFLHTVPSTVFLKLK